MTNKRKKKGSYYETKIAKIIKESMQLENYECKRASASGNEEFEFADIYFTNPKKYGIVLECKFHNDWDFRSVWPEVNAKFIGFLEEVDEAYHKYIRVFNRDPIFCGVVFSKPYYKNFVLTWYNYDIPKIICANKYNSKQLYVYEFISVISVLKEIIERRDT
jgi:hypothetical protein